MGVSVYEQEKLLEERRQQLLNRYKRQVRGQENTHF